MTTTPEQLELGIKVTTKSELVNHRLGHLLRLGTRCTALNLVCAGAATLLGTAVYPIFPVALVAVSAGVFSLVAFVAAGLKRALVDADLDRLRLGAARLEDLQVRLTSGRLGVPEAEEVLAAILSGLPALPNRHPGLYKVTGKILFPSEHSTVGEFFKTRGTVQNVDPRLHIWLTADVGGKCWPKNGVVDCTDGFWEQMVHQPSRDPFGLTLWAATPGAHRELLEWLESGAEQQHYPGLAPIKGMRLLDHVGDLHVAAATQPAAMAVKLGLAGVTAGVGG